MTPYISIVIVGRNDDYGVNFIERLNAFIKHLDYQTIKYPNLFELVIVEWNPLFDRAKLKDCLPKTKNYSIRIITVPEALHKLTKMNSPVLEFWGKNVGIRRARGDFVLISNPDIIFSNELINALAKKELQDDLVYRTDRYDYNGDQIQNVSVSNYINFAIKNSFKVHLCPESISISQPKSFGDLPSSQQNLDLIFTNASGDFILSARKNFEKSKGLAWENSITKGHVDSFSLIRLFKAAKLRGQVIFTNPLCIFHMDHPRKPNYIQWRPDIAVSTVDWAGWFAKPSWFDENWGLGNYNLEEWNNKDYE